jgi:RimJ/RimL family protein N-acetyltransferase
MQIETPRLMFRQFIESDLAALAAIRADADVMRHIEAGLPQTMPEVRAKMHGVTKHWSEKKFGLWVTVYKPDQAIIGLSGLFSREGQADIELGYAFAKGYWGLGLATEAAPAILKFGFETMTFNRIIAVARPENTSSLHVMEKIGMTFHQNRTDEHGELVCYEITRDAYLKQQDKLGMNLI